MFKLIIGRMPFPDEVATFISGDSLPWDIQKNVSELLEECYHPYGNLTELTICTFSPVAIDAVEVYMRNYFSSACEDFYETTFVHKNGKDVCISSEYDVRWLAKSTLSSLWIGGKLNT
jgi:hypothetical protein